MSHLRNEQYTQRSAVKKGFIVSVDGELGVQGDPLNMPCIHDVDSAFGVNAMELGAYRLCIEEKPVTVYSFNLRILTKNE
jgi:hypothetical protein